MAGALILVRHAMPEVTPGLASTLWPLSAAAREDCVLLAHALPPVLAPLIYTSPERKALETAAVVALRRGLEVVTDPGLREVDRPATWDDDYREAAARYLADGGRDGWEPAAAVRVRVAAAVERARARHPQGDLVVVGHGLALSLFLAGAAAVDLVAFWRALTFPDAWRLDPALPSTLTRIHERGLPPP